MQVRIPFLKGMLGHIALLTLNFFVLVGIIESFQIFLEDIPLTNILILGYMLTHSILILSIQLGVQILELVRMRKPTFLISYYFQLDDNEAIPIPLLDPTKSKLAVLALLLVVTGAPLLYPIFAVYGFVLVYAYLLLNPLNPSMIIQYFEIFLNWMPPIFMVIFGILIISVVIIEFRHA